MTEGLINYIKDHDYLIDLCRGNKPIELLETHGNINELLDELKDHQNV
jgi:hypothetical protein